MSETLSPRGILDAYQFLKMKRINRDTFEKLVGWCDLCGKCDELFPNVYKIIMEQYPQNIEEQNINVIKDGMYHIVIPELLISNEYMMGIFQDLLNSLSELGLDIGLVSYGKLTYLISSLLRNNNLMNLYEKLASEGINKIIIGDIYTFRLLLPAKNLRLWSLSSIVGYIYNRSDIYPIKLPSIKISLINSSYRFYQSEYGKYSRIINILPSVNFSISRAKVGVAYAFMFPEYSEKIAKYIDLILPHSSYIISTVDPFLYIIYHKYLSSKYAISYLPFFLIKLLRKI